MDRREAVKRISALLGFAVSGPTMAGILSGCQATQGPFRTLTQNQHDLLAIMSEHIIPTTDTPGAKEAGVADFIDAMLTDFYSEERRESFLQGLAEVDDLAKEELGKAFGKCSDAEQFELLDKLDNEAFPDLDAMGEAERKAFEEKRRAQGRPFIATLKELTISGYYTSEIGATQELHLNPSIPYRGDIPFSEVGKAWA